jgi:hypothetical protein
VGLLPAAFLDPQYRVVSMTERVRVRDSFSGLNTTSMPCMIYNELSPIVNSVWIKR